MSQIDPSNPSHTWAKALEKIIVSAFTSFLFLELVTKASFIPRSLCVYLSPTHLTHMPIRHPRTDVEQGAHLPCGYVLGRVLSVYRNVPLANEADSGHIALIFGFRPKSFSPCKASSLGPATSTLRTEWRFSIDVEPEKASSTMAFLCLRHCLPTNISPPAR